MNVLPIIALASLLAVAPPDNEPARPRVLVFTKTAGFRHDAIPAGIAAVRELAAEGGLRRGRHRGRRGLHAGEPGPLPRHRVPQHLGRGLRRAAEGGIPGLHPGAAAGSRRSIRGSPHWKSGHGTWRWSGGVKFAGHPQVQKATCRREVRDHPATKSLPDSWEWADEWYNFDPNPRPQTRVLVTVDESTYQGREDGQGPPRLLVPGVRERTRLVHSPRAHEGRLRPAGLAQAFARRHPVRRGFRAGRARRRTAHRRPAFIRETFARFAREHPGDPARGRAPVLRTQRSRLRPGAIGRAARVAISARTSPRSAASTSAPC